MNPSLANVPLAKSLRLNFSLIFFLEYTGCTTTVKTESVGTLVTGPPMPGTAEGFLGSEPAGAMPCPPATPLVWPV